MMRIDPMHTKAGGPAFPLPVPCSTDGTGMSLLDWFAADAMRALVGADAAGLAAAVSEGKGRLALDNTARLAYLVAAAMLRERERPR